MDSFLDPGFGSLLITLWIHMDLFVDPCESVLDLFVDPGRFVWWFLVDTFLDPYEYFDGSVWIPF